MLSALKNKNILIILFVLCFKTTLFSQSIDSLKYGFGGGFSGLMTYYKINPKGVYKGVGKIENRYQDKAKISSRKIKLLFKDLALNIKLFPNYIHPNNQYVFFSIYAGQHEYNAVWNIWDMNDKSIPENLIIIEKKINAFINNLKFVSND
jgi:hypothetical protein